MLRQQFVAPLHLSLPGPVTTTTVSCSRGRRRRSSKPKRTAFPPPAVRRLVSSLRRLLPLPRPLTTIPGRGGGGWLKRRRKMPTEEILTLALSLVLGADRLAVVAAAWKASGLDQAVRIWAALWGRGRKSGGALRRLTAFLLGVAFCTVVCHLRGAAFLEGLQKSGGGRKLVQILLR